MLLSRLLGSAPRSDCLPVPRTVYNYRADSGTLHGKSRYFSIIFSSRGELTPSNHHARCKCIQIGFLVEMGLAVTAGRQTPDSPPRGRPRAEGWRSRRREDGNRSEGRCKEARHWTGENREGSENYKGKPAVTFGCAWRRFSRRSRFCPQNLPGGPSGAGSAHQAALGGNPGGSPQRRLRRASAIRR